MKDLLVFLVFAILAAIFYIQFGFQDFVVTALVLIMFQTCIRPDATIDSSSAPRP